MIEEKCLYFACKNLVNSRSILEKDSMLNQTSVPLTNPEKLQATEEQLIQFLKEHNEIEMILPVIIGVVVTSRFQLRGANALLVNLAVAGISRQVFATIKKQSPTVIAGAATQGVANHGASDDGEYTIVHSVPGRIRIKVPQLAEDQDFAHRLQNLLNEDDHVSHARINRAAASVVINYDAQGLSDLELGLRLLSIMNNAKGNEETSNMN